MTVRTRFAPSPTGYLHLGGLRTALYTYLYAKKNGGNFILRIEDTDQEREVPGAVEKIYNSMNLAGLHYDEGPDVGGDFGPYIQSQRRDTYLPYAMKLVESGAAYPCFCSKEELDERRAAATADGGQWKYDKHCLSIPKEEALRRMQSGEPFVIRQNIPTTGTASFEDALYGHVEAPCDTLDDNVLIKQDGLPTYNFANVIDDHLMGITHVMRGTEYLSSTPKYNLLYEAFGWEAPKYIHLPPVMADATRKLSKRRGDPSFEDLLNEGYLKDAIINYMALLGWSPGTNQEFFTLEELEKTFHLEGINKSPAIFDINKLIWFNAEYIRRLSFEEYCEYATPWLRKGGIPEGMDITRLCQLLQNRTEIFNQLPEMVDFLVELPEMDTALYTHKKMKTTAETALPVLKAALPELEAMENWSEEALHETLMALVGKLEMKNGQVLWPIRVALSAKASTPGGATEIAYLLGKEETLRRMKLAIAQLEG